MKAPFIWFGGKRRVAAQTDGRQGNQANRRLERLWFSPHCLDQQLSLLEQPA